MSLFTSNAGKSVLKPETVASLVIRPLIEKAVAANVATVLSIDSHDVRVPVVADDPTASWVPEGQEIPASDAVLAEVRITPAKLAGLSVISNELAADSSPAALQVVGEGLVRDLARQMDAAFFGTVASPEAPKGLASIKATEILVSDTLSVGVPVVDGAIGNGFDWAVLAQAYAEQRNTKITAFIASPGRVAYLEMRRESETSYRSLMQPDPTSPTGRRIAGVPLFSSPAVDDQTVWCVPQSHAFVAIRQNASVEADRSAFFSSDQTALRAILRVGYGFSYEEAVVKVKFDKPLLSGG